MSSVIVLWPLLHSSILWSLFLLLWFPFLVFALSIIKKHALKPKTWNFLSSQIYMLLFPQLVRFFLFFNFGWTTPKDLRSSFFFLPFQFNFPVALNIWKDDHANCGTQHVLNHLSSSQSRNHRLTDPISTVTVVSGRSARVPLWHAFLWACMCCRCCCYRLQRRACGFLLSLKNWRLWWEQTINKEDEQFQGESRKLMFHSSTYLPLTLLNIAKITNMSILEKTS